MNMPVIWAGRLYGYIVNAAINQSIKTFSRHESAKKDLKTHITMTMILLQNDTVSHGGKSIKFVTST